MKLIKAGAILPLFSFIKTSDIKQKILPLFVILSLFCVIFIAFYFPRQLGLLPEWFRSSETKKYLIGFLNYGCLTFFLLALVRKFLRLGWQELGFCFTRQNKAWLYWICYGVLCNIFFHTARISYWYVCSLYKPFTVETILPYHESLVMALNSYAFSPLFEEIIFRGVLLTVLLKYLKNKIALFISALFFCIASPILRVTDIPSSNGFFQVR